MDTNWEYEEMIAEKAPGCLLILVCIGIFLAAAPLGCGFPTWLGQGILILVGIVVVTFIIKVNIEAGKHQEEEKKRQEEELELKKLALSGDEEAIKALFEQKYSYYRIEGVKYNLPLESIIVTAKRSQEDVFKYTANLLYDLFELLPKVNKVRIIILDKFIDKKGWESYNPILSVEASRKDAYSINRANLNNQEILNNFDLIYQNVDLEYWKNIIKN